MKSSVPILTRKYLLPFILITSCFALWGFANDITNPMVKAFSKIFRMSVAEGTLVQAAFYGGYFLMALPAALFVRRFSYKAGILVGLLVYAIGALLFFPAKELGTFYPFLAAYLVMTCGLAFLETSANPFILSMGYRESATRRLNLAQAFNPVGSLVGMFVAMNFIQARLNPMSSAERMQLDPQAFELVKQQDLSILIKPYLLVVIVIVSVLLLIFFVRMPREEESGNEGLHRRLSETFHHLWNNKIYREGVVAQFFYVGAQIMCWTFIIQYGTPILMAEGMTEQAAEVASQQYNIMAMIIFCSSRFVCTFLMKYLNPGRFLAMLSTVAIVLLVVVMSCQSRLGLYALVGVSACMSLMYPTIYALALGRIDAEDSKIGAACIVMAILGGAVLPILQASIIDLEEIAGYPAVHLSFIVPLLCFVVINIFGWRAAGKS